jgi:hypothetical protein
MTATTTPALELAAVLYALAEHLVEHPHLPSVNLSRPGPGDYPAVLQISGFTHVGELNGIPALLGWAQSLDDCRIFLREHVRNNTSVYVEGLIGGIRMQIWDVDEGDLYRWRGAERDTSITLGQLAAYVAAGTVEHAGEHTAATS